MTNICIARYPQISKYNNLIVVPIINPCDSIDLWGMSFLYGSQIDLNIPQRLKQIDFVSRSGERKCPPIKKARQLIIAVFISKNIAMTSPNGRLQNLVDFSCSLPVVMDF